jgi:transposase
LSAAVEQQAQQRPEVLRLMTHPGVGPTTALAFVLIIDSAERFACGKQMRKEWNCLQLKRFGSYAGESKYVHGVQ